MLGKVISKRGILAVKTPPLNSPQPTVPGVLGMNVIRECYNELSQQHGTVLFDLPFVSQTSSPWFTAFQFRHQVQVESKLPKMGMMWGRGRRPICIPAGTVKIVTTTCPQGIFVP